MKVHLSAKQKELDKKIKNQQKSKDALSKKGAEPLQKQTNNIPAEKPKEGDIKREPKANKKSLAKAMGFKSALSFDNKVVITSFMERNSDNIEKSAHIEKITDNYGAVIEEEPRMFNTDVDSKKVIIRKNIRKGLLNKGLADKFTGEDDEKVELCSEFTNPSFYNCGKDYIGIKSAVEQKFFGRCFDNDNLRVQIAYNIMDVKKILGTYINNITYIFYNLGRKEWKGDNDVIGSFKEDEIKTMLKNTSAYYTYFDGVFKTASKNDNEKKKAEIESHNLSVVKLLSIIRQICVHDDVEIDSQKDNTVNADEMIFNIDKYLSGWKGLRPLLDEVYASGIKTINDDFINNSGNNLYILSQIYPEIKKNDLIKEYYDFVVRKESNNLGVNMRKLRETMIDECYPNLRNEDFNTFRNKLYTVLGFVMLKEVKKMGSIVSDMIEELRENMRDEESKDAIYLNYSKKVWKIISEKVIKVAGLFEKEKKMADDKSKEKEAFKGKLDIDQSLIDAIGVTADNSDGLTKIVYFLCKFLDGKEINELCCALINKFDNISDLILSAEQCGEAVAFVDEYTVLKNSKQLANQMRIVKNISKMKPEFNNVNEILLLDALEMLGYKINKYKKGADGKILADKDGKFLCTDEYVKFKKDFYETIKIGQFGQVDLAKDGTPKKDHKLRNFIVKNVLASKWFIYVAKYNNPSECCRIMKNRTLVQFALRDLPDSVVTRYYKTVTGNSPEGVSMDTMRKVISNKLRDFSIKNVTQDIAGLTENENKETRFDSIKETSKSIVKLYLTVAYLIAKSMVKVNTRVSIAFSMYDRDIAFKAESDEGVKKALFDVNGNRKSWRDSDYALALTHSFLAADKLLYEEYEANLPAIKATLDPLERAKMRRKNDKIIKNAHFNFHAYKCVNENYSAVIKIKNFSKIIQEYRNNVQHLNVINKMVDYIGEIKEARSYYAVYCYIMQKMIETASKKSSCWEEIWENEKLSSIAQSLNKYGMYNKDFMWMLNIQFAYNLPRYKNLSNEALFYDMV